MYIKAKIILWSVRFSGSIEPVHILKVCFFYSRKFVVTNSFFVEFFVCWNAIWCQVKVWHHLTRCSKSGGLQNKSWVMFSLKSTIISSQFCLLMSGKDFRSSQLHFLMSEKTSFSLNLHHIFVTEVFFKSLQLWLQMSGKSSSKIHNSITWRQ